MYLLLLLMVTHYVKLLLLGENMLYTALVMLLLHYNVSMHSRSAGEEAEVCCAARLCLLLFGEESATFSS